jgi:hypothetical protein
VTDPFPIGARVTLAGRSPPYVVREVQATEGGTYRLGLRPGVAPFDLLWIGVWRNRMGVWLTDDLECIEYADGTYQGLPNEVRPEMPEGYSPCKGVGCGKPIRWDVTATGKRTPLNPDGSSHWDTCIAAGQFKRHTRSAAAAEALEVPDDSGQMSLF